MGSIGLAVGMIGAVVALRKAYTLGIASVVLMLVSIPLIAIHEPPMGPVGLALFIVAVLLFVRESMPAPAPAGAPVGQARPAAG